MPKSSEKESNFERNMRKYADYVRMYGKNSEIGETDRKRAAKIEETVKNLENKLKTKTKGHRMENHWYNELDRPNALKKGDRVVLSSKSSHIPTFIYPVQGTEFATEGTVREYCDDGSVIVAWDNGYRGKMLPKHLEVVGADRKIDPNQAFREKKAFGGMKNIKKPTRGDGFDTKWTAVDELIDLIEDTDDYIDEWYGDDDMDPPDDEQG